MLESWIDAEERMEAFDKLVSPAAQFGTSSELWTVEKLKSIEAQMRKIHLSIVHDVDIQKFEGIDEADENAETDELDVVESYSKRQGRCAKAARNRASIVEFYRRVVKGVWKWSTHMSMRPESEKRGALRSWMGAEM